MGAVIPAGAASGQTVYGQILSAIDGSVWNGSGMEPFNGGHWSNYTVAGVEQAGSGRYILTVPGGLPAGRYIMWLLLATLNSPTPTIGDQQLDFVFFDWDGGNALGNGSGVNVIQINGVALAAQNLAASAGILKIGAAAAGTLTTSQMTTNLVDAVANLYAGRLLTFTSGVNKGLTVLITAYAVTGGKLTFIGYNNLPAPSVPSALDTFIIT